jgi:hypothetical protein
MTQRLASPSCAVGLAKPARLAQRGLGTQNVQLVLKASAFAAMLHSQMVRGLAARRIGEAPTPAPNENSPRPVWRGGGRFFR